MPAVEIKYEDIYFDPKVQTLCVTTSFTCPNYNHSHSCPPVAPYLEEEVSKYKKFFLIYSQFDLENHIKEVKAKHPKRSEYRIKLAFQMKSLFREDLDEEFNKFLESFNGEYKERLLLYDGTCRICLNKEEGGCTFDDGKPCRYPNRRKYSMEAVGIEVIRSIHQLQKTNKIHIEYPSNKYSYRFGLACFK